MKFADKDIIKTSITGIHTYFFDPDEYVRDTYNEHFGERRTTVTYDEVKNICYRHLNPKKRRRCYVVQLTHNLGEQSEEIFQHDWESGIRYKELLKLLDENS